MSKRNEYHKHKSQGLETRYGGPCQTHWTWLDKPGRDDAKDEPTETEEENNGT